MAWDWIEKGAKRVQALGAEYKQHAATVERLLKLDPQEATQEFSRLWPAMDERSRAALEMTLAGLTLAQQGAPKSPEAAARAERLKELHSLIEGAPSVPAAVGSTPFGEAGITASAARVTHKMADFAERAKPRAAEALESARKGIERHGPAIEAAAKAVLAEIVKAKIGEQAPRGSSDTNTTGESPTTAAPEQAQTTPRPAPPPFPAAAPTPAGGVPIAGLWEGELAGATGTLNVAFRIMPSGRPAYGYQEQGRPFRLEELTHEHQTIQYVPPGGGVVTVVVQRVLGSPTESGYVIKYSFEGSNNGYLTQRYQDIALTCRLRGSQLETTYVETGRSYFGDRTGLAGGSGGSEYSGVLRRTEE